jgi:hypothetical protein
MILYIGEIMSKKMYQEWFDKALNGIRAQGCPSVRGATCCYDDGKGNRCALGHLFPDGYSLTDVAGTSPCSLYNRGNPYTTMRWERHLKQIGANGGDVEFLLDLQCCHDCSVASSDERGRFRRDFEKAMRALAGQYGLEYQRVK